MSKKIEAKSLERIGIKTYMDIHSCIEGQRYRFYKDCSNYFEAEFIGIVRDTLKVTKYIDKNGECNGIVRTMPKIWIIKVVDLKDITYDNVIWKFLCPC